MKRIRQYGLEQGVKIEHYIISSGLKEMIEGTEMAKEGAFTKIYASAFMFDDKGVAVWPAQAINYTNKTQFFVPHSKKEFSILMILVLMITLSLKINESHSVT